MASATRKSAVTVTMSVRGTITSRTTVSPSSMTDSMRRALLGLDHLVLDGEVGHGEQLLLRRVRARASGPCPGGARW